MVHKKKVVGVPTGNPKTPVEETQMPSANYENKKQGKRVRRKGGTCKTKIHPARIEHRGDVGKDSHDDKNRVRENGNPSEESWREKLFHYKDLPFYM